jgi:predicted nucleic acid-binding protein
MPGSFFDTNVMVYVASGDPAKADRAEELIGAGGTISVQVLNEIANVARRKMGLSWTETRAFLSMIRGLLPVQPLTVEVHETGLALAERYGLSTWDAMIAASALHADCDTRVRARRPSPHRQPVSCSPTLRNGARSRRLLGFRLEYAVELC